MSFMEQPRNSAEKTLACIILDRSGSMSGVIDDLNQGVKDFLEDIRNDPKLSSRLEVSLISFDDEVEVIQQPDLAAYINYTDQTPGGCTALVDAIRKGIEVVETRKEYYRANNIKYKLPWIIVMSDGGETEKPQELSALSSEIETLTKTAKFTLLPVALADEAVQDLDMLSGYKPQKDASGTKFVKTGVARLNEKRFSEFFEWLSASFVVVSTSTESQGVVQVQDPSSWMLFPTS